MVGKGEWLFVARQEILEQTAERRELVNHHHNLRRRANHPHSLLYDEHTLCQPS